MKRAEKIETFRKAVIALADAAGEEGWITFAVPRTVSEDGRLRVPRAPFEHWAVDLAGGSHLAMPWKTVSPVGMKQGADDPNHTDWMLGAGLDPMAMKSNGGNPHWEELSQAVYRARAAMEKRLLDFDCSILLQGHTVEGRVHVPATADDYPQRVDDMPPVTVLKNAGSRWFEIALKTYDLGGAVIVENGGETAHLVTELRATAGPMIRKENARKLFPAGSLVRVEPARGRVTLREDELLVSERAASAMRGEPLQDDPEPAVEAPKPHVPGFGLVEVRNGISKHPSYHTGFVEFSSKLECSDFDIYSTFHYDKKGHFDMHHGYQMYLHVMVSPRDSSDRAGRRLFVSALRTWKDGEARQACQDVRDIVDPEARNEWMKWQRIQDEQRARERAKLDLLSNDALVALMAVHGRDENGLWDEYESGTIDNSERVQMLSEYGKLFAIFEQMAADRGLDLDMDAIRPHKATHAKRMEWVSDYQDNRDKTHQEALAAIPRPR